mgnify:CR=1 FL=1
MPRLPPASLTPAMPKPLQILVWIAISALGAGAVAFSALHKGETINALWLVVAWAAHHAGEAGLLNTATAMVGLRILAIYFEVFGTLLDTGLGLVSGGLLTLALVWLWSRKRRQFERELRRAP